jgi:hypothetical protein
MFSLAGTEEHTAGDKSPFWLNCFDAGDETPAYLFEGQL